MKFAFALVAAWAAGPSYAEVFEPVEIGHWNVFMQERNGCVALNRPISEMDHSREFGVEPAHVLGFIPHTRDDFGYMVFFWPGADSRSGGMDLRFDFGEVGVLSLPDDLGMPSDHGAAGRLSLEAKDAFVNPLSGGLVKVSTQSGNFGMIFDISDLGEVFDAMEDCMATYK